MRWNVVYIIMLFVNPLSLQSNIFALFKDRYSSERYIHWGVWGGHMLFKGSLYAE